MSISDNFRRQLETHETFKPIATIENSGQRMSFRLPNRAALWRVETLLTKEPCTIAWLNNIEPDAIFLDIGANVGMYTIYAAKVRGANVYAFEPEAQNYALLNQNIYQNKLSERVVAYCAAVSDVDGLTKLFLSKFETGSSCHSLGENVGFDLKPRESEYTQGAISFTIDGLIKNGLIPMPNYIKIDVDGFEHKVLSGAIETLKSPNLKSIIVELNSNIPQHTQVIEFLVGLGFNYDPEQVAAANRESGVFQGVGEWVFSREFARFRLLRVETPSIVRSDAKSEFYANLVSSKFKSEDVQYDPFPHYIINDIFPFEYYSEIQSNFPDTASMVPLSETGRTGKAYKERLVTLFNEDGFSKLSYDQREFWAGVAGWLYSPLLIDKAIRLFRGELTGRLSEISRRVGCIRVRGDALLVADQTNYGIGPHTDAPHRLITFLFYLPATDIFSKHGTTLYKPRDPGFFSVGDRHFSYDEFIEVKRIPFVPNSALIFPRTNYSFHGVDPIIDVDVTRSLLIFNIRLQDG